jgi:hypothetical protein
VGPADVDAGKAYGVMILNAATVECGGGIGVHSHVADLIRLHAIPIRPVQIVPHDLRLVHHSVELVLAESQGAGVDKGLGVRVGGEDRSAAHSAQHVGVAASRQVWCLFSTGAVRAREHGEVLADALRLHRDAIARLSGTERLAILQRVNAASGTERYGRGGGHA